MTKQGSLCMTLWTVIMQVLTLDQNPQPTSPAGDKICYAKPGRQPSPSLVLSTTDQIACVLLDGQEFLLLAPRKHLTFHP